MENLFIPIVLLIRFLMALHQEDRRIHSNRQHQSTRRRGLRIFHPAEFELR